MKKVLVTGSTGFIGSKLCRTLEDRGNLVSTFDIHNKQDICNDRQLEDAIRGVDVVFNLAAVMGTSELDENLEVIGNAIQVNVLGAVNVMDICSRLGKELVQVTKPNIWLNTYTITKEAAEKFAQLYNKQKGLKVWLVRWFNVFGEGQHYGKPQKLVPTTVVNALRGKPIPVFGTGNQVADHIYVEDAIEAAIAIYECPQLCGHAVEVGSGEAIKVNHLVQKIIKKIGSESKIEYLPMRRGEALDSIVVANNTVLQSIAGYKFKYSLDEGLDKTLKWYRQNLASIPTS